MKTQAFPLYSLEDLVKAKRTRVRGHERRLRTGKVIYVGEHGRRVNENPEPNPFADHPIKDVVPRFYIEPPELPEEEKARKARRERRQALMDKAIRRTEEYLDDARRILRVPIPPITVDFTLEGSTAGIAFGGHRISYNWNLLEDNEKLFLSETVPHEVAHIVVHHKYRDHVRNPQTGEKAIRDHGQTWKEVMRFFRAPADRTHIMRCEKSWASLLGEDLKKSIIPGHTSRRGGKRFPVRPHFRVGGSGGSKIVHIGEINRDIRKILFTYSRLAIKDLTESTGYVPEATQALKILSDVEEKLTSAGGITKHDREEAKEQVGRARQIIGDATAKFFDPQWESFRRDVASVHEKLGGPSMQGSLPLKKSRGEDSRGGKIIGHTKSGRPIYAKSNHSTHSEFTSKDHADAKKLHLQIYKKRGTGSHLRSADWHGRQEYKKRVEENRNKPARKLTEEEKVKIGKLQADAIRQLLNKSHDVRSLDLCLHS